MDYRAARLPEFESRFEGTHDQVFLVDTTLRDGEEAAGVVFAQQEKIRIARMLADIGVHEIVVGSPWLCPEEREAITEIASQGLGARVLAFCRAHPDDIASAHECGVDAIIISLATSDRLLRVKYNADRRWAMQQLERAATAAQDLHLPFVVSAEDASRTDLDFLLPFAVAAQKLGAQRFRFVDSLSMLDPFTTFQRIEMLVETLDVGIEVLFRNDFGMATANALAGVRAGARYVTVSVNGLGERTGTAALEEVVMALKYLDDVDLGITTQEFRELSEYVARASSRAIPVWKAIVGTNVFAHESGIHADGVIKNPLTYEVFSPDEVGLTRQLVVGKHSGSRTIQHKFKEFGIDLSDHEATEILAMTRRMSVDMKRALFEKELMYIYQDFLRLKDTREAARGGEADEGEEGEE